MDRIHPGRSRTGRRGPRILLALGAAMLLVAPGAPSVRAEDPASTLRIGVTTEPNTSNIFQCCSDWVQVALTYDALVGRDMQAQPVPGFAESWSASSDGLTWTFKIRAGMQWSDGQPADANDAAYTINRLAESIGTDNELASGWAYAPSISSVKKAEATDATTLVVTLKAPSVQVLFQYIPIVPKHIWASISDKDALGTYKSDPPLVTTGPYVLTEWRHGESQRLVRNDRYWGPRPAVDEIIEVFYRSQDAASQALRAGEIDVLAGASLGQYDTLAGAPGIVAQSAQSTNFLALVMNTRGSADGGGATTKALADVAFRDALGYAIDEKVVVDSAFAGHGSPGVGLIAPMDTVNYTGLPDIARRFDIEEAKRRLDAAGYVDANGDGTREDKDGKALNLRLLVDAANPQALTTAQLLAGWFAQVGITLSPQSLDIGALYDAVYKPDYDMYLGAHSPGYLTWDVMWYATAGNPHGWSDKAFDDQYAELWRTTDPEKRVELVRGMEATFYKAAAYHVLAYTDVIQAYSTAHFTGWDAPSGKVEELLPNSVYPEPLFGRLAPVGEATPSPASTAASPDPTGSSPAPAASPGASPAPAPTASDSGTLTQVGIVALVVVVALVAIGLLRRRSARIAA